MPSNQNAPTQSAKTSSGIVILHLSDLHFGNKNRFQGREMGEFGQQFSRAVMEAAKEQGWEERIDLVVIRGDIAEVARPKEFNLGLLFLKAMIGGMNVSPFRTLFVPGNHDFSWALCERVDADRKIEEFDEGEYQKRLDASKFQFYNDFLLKFYGLPDVNGLPDRILLDKTSGAYLQNFSIGGIPISFAGLNTSEKETHKIHGGELGKLQAEALIQAWMSPEYAGHLKVAIVHHNPLATPPENLQWSEDWFVRQIAEKHLDVTPDVLRHYTADMAGFKGSQWLQRIVHDTDTHLILHGHHHNPTAPVMWPHRGDGVAAILSVGSFGLNADQIPTDQPLVCQLLYFQIEPEPRLIAVPLEYNANFRLPGTLDKGQFRYSPQSEGRYNKPFFLPLGWIGRTGRSANKTETYRRESKAKKLMHFVTYYRNHLMGLHSSYDLKNLGVLPAEMHKTSSPKLDDLYLPLRFAEKFDINDTDQGNVVNVEVLRRLFITPVGNDRSQKLSGRKPHLTITGAAGAGKTTWMRYTFRRMREYEHTLPFLVELRAVAKFWMERPSNRDKRSIEAYLEYWLKENAPEYEAYGVSLQDLLEADAVWSPVLFIDGWDELGDIGTEFQEKLIGLMQHYPKLSVIASSRPYGIGRLSGSDGFTEYFVQPLSPKEIERFTLNFYTKCYQEEETLVKSQAAAFAQALERSEDAKLLAKTPLLLTMMLFINRSKRLPDKRHQLYGECLMSLLSERPGMQSEEGAQLLAGQWCPEETGPARLQIVARMAYDLQTAHLNQHTGSENAATIIVTKETVKDYLPNKWSGREKDGFLLWLCGRAGVMVDDTQDHIWFAHLSFQEFLAAFYLNNNVVSHDAESSLLKLAEKPVWWETLLLWAALLNDQSKERAEQILQSLLNKEHVLLVGMMLADGIGSQAQMDIWSASFIALISEGWPEQTERCLRAWQASRQEERRERLLVAINSVAGEANWSVWLQLSNVVRGVGHEARLPINHPNSIRQGPLLTLFPDIPMTRKGFASARTLSGNGIQWPAYPVGLLHLWASERRASTLELQRLSALGAEREELKAYLVQKGENRLVKRQVRLSSRTVDVANFIISQLAFNVARDLTLDLVLDLARDLDSDLDLDIPRDLARDLDFAGSSSLAHAVGSGGAYARAFARARALARDLTHSRDRQHEVRVLQTRLWDVNLLRTLFALVRVQPAKNKSIPILSIALFHTACLVYVTRGRLGREELVKNIAITSECGIDPLWIALARHVARLSTEEDRALLKDLAAHPEKREGELSWGLQYLVRGDILLPDDTEVTLDELCIEAGVPLYPLLEDMPPELEYEETES